MVERDLSTVLDAGRKRQISLAIYLPDPDGDGFEQLAARLGTDAATYRTTIADAAKRIELAWKGAGETQPLKSGSSIDIVLYPEVPGYSLCIVDGRAVLLFTESLQRAPIETGLAIQFDQVDGFPWVWLVSQFKAIEDRNYGAQYSNIVES